jgi:hypothetical protein
MHGRCRLRMMEPRRCAVDEVGKVLPPDLCDEPHGPEWLGGGSRETPRTKIGKERARRDRAIATTVAVVPGKIAHGPLQRSHLPTSRWVIAVQRSKMAVSSLLLGSRGRPVP